MGFCFILSSTKWKERKCIIFLFWNKKTCWDMSIEEAVSNTLEISKVTMKTVGMETLMEDRHLKVWYKSKILQESWKNGGIKLEKKLLRRNMLLPTNISRGTMGMAESLYSVWCSSSTRTKERWWIRRSKNTKWDRPEFNPSSHQTGPYEDFLKISKPKFLLCRMVVEIFISLYHYKN